MSVHLYVCLLVCNQYVKQDGPSLESGSYLNVTLRYLGPWVSGTLGPWDPLTLALLDYRTSGPIPSSTTSSYLLVWYDLVWFGVVWFGIVLGAEG